MRISKWLATGVCAGTCFFAGVAMAADAVAPSGFLGDAYPKMLDVKAASKQKVKRWMAPEVTPANYDSLMLQPTVLYPEPQGTEQASIATLNEITAYMDVALKRELGEVINIVTEPGPKTLKLRPAITAAAAKDMGLKPYQFVPIGFVLTMGQTTKKATLAVEFEVQDSSTGKVVGAGMRQSAGQDIKSMKDKLTLENIKPAVDIWAKDARAFVAASNFKK